MKLSVFPIGEPDDAYAQYFIGQSYLNMLSTAPKFAQLNDDVLFGETWSREDNLSARERGN